MSEKLINRVLAKVVRKMGGDAPAPSVVPTPTPTAEALPTATEFIGINVLGNTISMIITSVDPKLRAMMKLEKGFCFIGVLGTRTGAGPHIFAADGAIKATNSEILAIELPCDTKDGAGHGSLIVFGAEDVSGTRRTVEVALSELDRTFSDVYGNDAGRLEFQYTARAPYALNKVFDAPIGKTFGITVGAPADTGVVLVDTAIKAAIVNVIGCTSPTDGTSYSDEVISFLSGGSGAIRQAIVTAHEMGIPLLGALGTKPESTTTPYI